MAKSFENSPGRVLLVEDDPMQSNVIRMMLNITGIDDVTIAKNGEEGLEAITAADPSFRIVVTDWNMPRMNGLEFIDRLRGMPGGDRISVILLTAFKQADVNQYPEAEKADAILFKPITPDGLAVAIATAIKGRG